MTDFFSFSNASTTVISAGSRPWDKGGGGGGAVSRTTFFRPYGPQLGLKRRGGPGPPGPPGSTTGNPYPFIYLTPKFRSEPPRMDHYRGVPLGFPHTKKRSCATIFHHRRVLLIFKNHFWMMLKYHITSCRESVLLILSTFTSLTTSVWLPNILWNM